MGMILDTRVKDNEGFAPTVQNKEQQSMASPTAKFMFYVLCLVTLGLFFIYKITKKNWFNRKQISINTAASNIDVQLIKRKDTLVKLVDATKSSVKFEKSLLTDVTRLRGINGTKNSNEISDLDAKVSGAFGRLIATMENYPKLQSTETIQSLMQTADYCEREIAANRRVYNAEVNEFNQTLFV
jgi:LemA protein